MELVRFTCIVSGHELKQLLSEFGKLIVFHHLPRLWGRDRGVETLESRLWGRDCGVETESNNCDKDMLIGTDGV